MGVHHRGTPGKPVNVRPVERTCYLIGALLIVSGLFHLVVLVGSGGSWEGPLSWRKPMTFGLSFGLTLITIAWVASYIRLSSRARGWLLGAFAAACVVEVSLITAQAWRRLPSHFNMETALDSAISRVLAGGGGILIVVIGALTVASWRTDTRVAPSMRLAVRAGLLALDVALLIGATMIVIGVSRVVGGDQQAAYGAGEAWKLAHAVTMHGVLVLPLLAVALTRTTLDERQRLRIVWWAVAGYAVLCGAIVTDSLYRWWW